MNLARVEPIVQGILRRNDLVLAALVMLTAAMIILPMPTPLVDVLIGVSIATAVTLIMVAVYIPSPLAFASFPSVLLLSTLFRLALSITTTRLILLDADAGQIISTFGEFVVGGNVIVGLVIFLIITVVQFIVVTKGAERVAEVSARFSLDGMPGKQMSIDADMRAGVIDIDQARLRRQRVEKESQLYGSLDGAMKFVKGDAIAGIFIILINIIGGITIGMMQHGLDFSGAVSLFTVLTVGDGLVAQIPALLIAITAGIVVTRVTTREGSNLGQDIGEQILGQPRALLVSSVLMFGLALVPGFPSLVFIGIGGLLGVLGLVLEAARRRSDADRGSFISALSADGEFSPDAMAEPQAKASLPRASAVLLELRPEAEDGLDHRALNAEFARVRRQLFMDLGVPAPDVQLCFDARLEADTYRISVHEVPVATGTLKAGHLMVEAGPQTLEGLGLGDSERVADEGAASGYAWVAESARSQLLESGIHHLGAARVLSQHIGLVLERHASELIGVQETKSLLDGMIADSADLAKEASSTIPLPVLAETLKRLVAEGVPVRNLSIILECVLKWIGDSKEPGMLSEKCRKALRRQISHRFGRDGLLRAVVLDADATDIARKIHPGEVDAVTRRRFHGRLVKTLQEAREQDAAVVLVVSPEFRQPMREFVRRDLPQVPVLCFDDISDDVEIEPVARITMTQKITDHRRSEPGRAEPAP